MSYSDAINRLKSALSVYSDDEQKLKELYSRARSDLGDRYGANLSSVEEDYLNGRKEAAADVMREERNLFNMLAARGLGFSGETAQAKLNSSITLNNRLAGLAKEKSKADAELYNAYSGDLLKLDTEEGEKLEGIAEKKNKLLNDIADLELKRDSRKAAERAASAASQSQSQQSGGGSSAGGLYTPGIPAKDLAKLIVSSATGKNSIANAADHEKVTSTLEDIKNAYSLDPKYLNDLTVALKAYGYTADPKKAGEITKSQLVADSKKYYSGIYDRYMMTMQLIGDRAWTAKKKAYDYAQRRTAIYILQLAGSAADYREICGECGIGEDVMNSVYKEFKGDGENANGDGTSGNRLTVPHAIMK